MEIKYLEQDGKGEFAAYVDGVEAGKITFVKSSAEFIIADHTEVNDAFRGQKIGNKIVEQMVEHARENKIKILPLCPFVKSVFDKDGTISDVRK